MSGFIFVKSMPLYSKNKHNFTYHLTKKNKFYSAVLLRFAYEIDQEKKQILQCSSSYICL